MGKMSEMNRYDLSSEALDEGLSSEDIADFEGAASVFEARSARVTYEGANARSIAEAHAAWLTVGAELLKLFGQARGASAVKKAERDAAAKAVKDSVTAEYPQRNRLRNILSTKWASLRSRFQRGGSV